MEMRMPRILLVEDEAVMALGVQCELEAAGHEIIWASTWAEASSTLRGAGPGLAALVTDVNLGPGPDGYDVANLAREIRPDIPVVYMTASPAAEFLRRGTPGGRLLAKPFRPPDLVGVVSQMLGQACGQIDRSAA
jgi:CheY-like chemotaxis protein